MLKDVNFIETVSYQIYSPGLSVKLMQVNALEKFIKINLNKNILVDCHNEIILIYGMGKVGQG